MSFVALPASSVDQPPAEETLVTNDGFFPDIDPAAVRDAARITGSITPARLRAAILSAIMTVEIDLRAFAASSIAAGHATLADIPAPQLDGQSVQLLRYQRAVALYAKAELIARHPDFDTTGAGDAFFGGFLSRFLAYGKPLKEVSLDDGADYARFGNATASLCVERRGGIPAMPKLADVLNRFNA